MEKLDVVDLKDNVIGSASRAMVYEKGLMHRIVHVYVFNSKGELALQRRSATCDYCPLYFGTSAAGHVMAGESYDNAARRELEEELGINSPLEFIGKELYTEDARGNMKFISVFKTTYDGDFTIDQNEVESVRWLSMDRVNEMQKSGELFAPQLVYILDRFFIEHNN